MGQRTMYCIFNSRAGRPFSIGVPCQLACLVESDFYFRSLQEDPHNTLILFVLYRLILYAVQGSDPTLLSAFFAQCIVVSARALPVCERCPASYRAQVFV